MHISCTGTGIFAGALAQAVLIFNTVHLCGEMGAFRRLLLTWFKRV
jgi:hypothetical protein